MSLKPIVTACRFTRRLELKLSFLETRRRVQNIGMCRIRPSASAPIEPDEGTLIACPPMTGGLP
jgi:hypothetical protein